MKHLQCETNARFYSNLPIIQNTKCKSEMKQIKKFKDRMDVMKPKVVMPVINKICIFLISSKMGNIIFCFYHLAKYI